MPNLRKRFVKEGDRTFVIFEVEERSVAETGISPGDLFMAERNSGVRTLTCSTIGPKCVYSEEQAYPYDFHECYLIKH